MISDYEIHIVLAKTDRTLDIIYLNTAQIQRAVLYLNENYKLIIESKQLTMSGEYQRKVLKMSRGTGPWVSD